MLNFNQIADFILGECIRNIESPEKTIYLTFYDGPNEYCTPGILDLLKKHNAKASFFVIGDNIYNHTSVLNRIRDEGHAIGNHSINHDTKTYFKGKKALQKWISEAEAVILDHTGETSIGFRPPAGIRTPELKQVMRINNDIPILWQHRFFDTTLPFTIAAWKKKISKIKSGDIILLHDTHKKQKKFLASLEAFIITLTENDFQLKAISKAIMLNK